MVTNRKIVRALKYLEAEKFSKCDRNSACKFRKVTEFQVGHTGTHPHSQLPTHASRTYIVVKLVEN